MTFRAVIPAVLCSAASPGPLSQGFVPVVGGFQGLLLPPLGWLCLWSSSCSSPGAHTLPVGGGERGRREKHSLLGMGGAGTFCWQWFAAHLSLQCAFHSGSRVTRASAAGTRAGSHFPYANSSVCLALLQTPPGS